MEDAFWESPYNSSLQDEYFLIKQNVSGSDFFKKQELLYNNNLRFIKDSKLKSGLLNKTFLTDTNVNSKNTYSLPIFSEESITNPTLTTYKDFSSFANETVVDSSEEVYESSKYVNYLYYLNYKNIINSTSSNIQPLSYLTVFDNFRPDYEDPFLYTDDFSDSENIDVNHNLKLSNPFKLRSTVKNAMVTYSAIQKVFILMKVVRILGSKIFRTHMLNILI
jgi:hypothetical protein